MAIDNKTAKYICNVIQRQLHENYRGLHINFITHKENEREKAFNDAKSQIAKQKGGSHIIKYITGTNSSNILKRNSSQLVALSSYNNLMALQIKNCFALCFVNYDHYDNENHLRNDVFNLTYHAIALYNDFITNKNRGKDSKFYFKNNIIVPKLNIHDLCHRNLKADTFTSIVQTLLGRPNVLYNLSTQRMFCTLTPRIHFAAENFPFPMCIDTLDFVYEHNIDKYKRSKNPFTTAIKVAEEIGLTYDSAIIEQWRSFSISAQEMTWIGYDPSVILGAALHTSESTYVQSIANIFSERLNIKPEMMSILQDYNPFTSKEVNERTHKKQCNELFRNLRSKISGKADYEDMLDISKKQNEILLQSSIMGWCASAIIQAANVINQSNEDDDISKVLDNANEAFDKEVDSISWDTLIHFSRLLLKKRRIGINDTKMIAESDDEFSSIYGSIIITDEHEYTIKPPPMMRG